MLPVLLDFLRQLSTQIGIGNVTGGEILRHPLGLPLELQEDAWSRVCIAKVEVFCAGREFRDVHLAGFGADGVFVEAATDLLLVRLLLRLFVL